MRVVVKNFIIENITPMTEEIVKQELWADAKSKFQEKAQDIASVTPSYKTIKEEGPDHGLDKCAVQKLKI